MNSAKPIREFEHACPRTYLQHGTHEGAQTVRNRYFEAWRFFPGVLGPPRALEHPSQHGGAQL